MFFRSANLISSAKFRVGFVESLKSASRFLVCVSVNFGFDWFCFVVSVFVRDWLRRFSKSACLFLAKVLVKIQIILF